MRDVKERAARIKLVVFDVDGVLTDGSLYLGEDRQEFKAFYSRDGHGMKMLKESGVELGIITGRSAKLVADRMASLGVEHVYQGQADKRAAFEHLLQKVGIGPDEAAYVGDDVVDLPAMLWAGLSIAVADAHPEVVKHAHWLTPSRGGRGAVRDVCEFVMQAQGSLDAMYRTYLGSPGNPVPDSAKVPPSKA